MSVLQDIIQTAADSKTSLSDVLRKARILATRLRNEALKDWVDKELNGYKIKKNLPEYRVIKARSCGYFAGDFGYEIKGIHIPSTLLEKDHKEWATTGYLMQSISAYEKLTEKSDAGSLRVNWPSDLILFYQDKLIEDVNLVSAWQEIPASSVFDLLDTVRNRVLSFALEIETESPDVGEASQQSQPISPEKVTQHFTNIILGDSNVVAAGANFSQVAANLSAGDEKALLACLRTIGINEVDLEELTKAINDDAPPSEKNRFGPKIAAWIGQITGKAAAGTLKVGTDIASQIITKGLLRYYGLE